MDHNDANERLIGLILKALQGLNVEQVLLRRKIPDRRGNGVTATLEYTPAAFAQKITDALVLVDGNWQRT